MNVKPNIYDKNKKIENGSCPCAARYGGMLFAHEQN